jgi:hypothetical protein
LGAIAHAPKVLPFDPASDEFGGPDSDKIMSSVVWEPDDGGGPGSRAGAQSCWIRPEGNFFLLDFAEDDPAAGTFGWDMQVILNAAGFPKVSYRDPGDPDNPFGASVEEVLGSDLGGATPAPIAVRFQGARAVKSIDDLCALDPTDPAGPILPASVTGWVRHPAELNAYFDYLPPAEAAALRPNLVRFAVIFDRGTLLVPGLIHAITDLEIRATPD